MKNRLYMLHPFMFALIPAVFLWGQNFGEVPLHEALPALLVSLLFGALAWLGFWIFFRNFEKLAVMSSTFLIITLLFGYLYNIFFDTSLLQVRFRWAFVVMFFAFAVLWYFVRKTKKDLSNFNKIVFTATLVFVLMSLVQVAFGYYNEYIDSRDNDVGVVSEIDSAVNEQRDIYYIILDGYSSPEVVRDVIGYKEIDETVSYLEGKGFFVADDSKSNYPWTLLSLPSSLNMMYLEDPSKDKRHFTMTENHAVKDFLKTRGYKYIHFGTDAFTYFNRYADKNVNIGLFSPYQTAVWHNTIFRPIQDLTGTRFEGLGERFGFLDSRMTQWERERFKLGRLAEIAGEEDAPIFAFAHFLLPKGEYVFDENGDFVTEEESKEKGNIQSYLDHVTYINKEIEKLVDVLLEGAESEPIIIIQGDHGFAFQNNLDVVDDFADPERARELVVPGKYSFPIFNALYFPNGGDELLYDSLTPVNTFRILFNYYFEQNLDLLEDVSYTEDPDNETQFVIWDKE